MEGELYDGKILKRILVADKHCDKDFLNVELGCYNTDNKYDTYTLKKLGNINVKTLDEKIVPTNLLTLFTKQAQQNVNVYFLDCEIALNGDTIVFKILEFDDAEHSVYCNDDCNYNHVNDMCGSQLFNPLPNQKSYGVYINISYEYRSAISLFITN
jgi:hypothetical protein